MHKEKNSSLITDNKPSRDLLLNELKLGYDRELEIKKIIENKANIIITVSGIIFPLLFGFGISFITNENIVNQEIKLYFKMILFSSIILNSVSIFLAVWALKLGEFIVPFGHNIFYEKNQTTINKNRINEFKNSNIIVFKNTLIDEYLESIKFNDNENKNRTKKIIIAYWTFFIGIIGILILLGIVFYLIQ